MAQTTISQLSTTETGDAESGYITTVRELEIWADTPENGIYAGCRYLVTTAWRGWEPGMRAVMVGWRSEPISDTTPTGIPVSDCHECGTRHPATRRHCTGCGRASAFITPTGACIACTNN